jgi:hypothetical protein
MVFKGFWQHQKRSYFWNLSMHWFSTTPLTPSPAEKIKFTRRWTFRNFPWRVSEINRHQFYLIGFLITLIFPIFSNQIKYCASVLQKGRNFVIILNMYFWFITTSHLASFLVICVTHFVPIFISIFVTLISQPHLLCIIMVPNFSIILKIFEFKMEQSRAYITNINVNE